MRRLFPLPFLFPVIWLVVGCNGTGPEPSLSLTPTVQVKYTVVLSVDPAQATQVLTPSLQIRPTPDEEVIIAAVFNSELMEYVLIENNSSVDQDMGGWYLFNPRSRMKFRFPDNFILPVGGSIRIYSGPNGIHNPPTDFYWTPKYLWNDATDDVILLNPAGRAMFWYTY